MGSNTKSNSQKPGVLIDNHHRHRRKREEETCTPKHYKAKLERQRSARLIHGDLKTTTRYAMALSKAAGLISLLAPIKYY
jgi:hypothetical protein